jgi:hypothetical protein
VESYPKASNSPEKKVVDQQIKVLWMPGAWAQTFIFKPLLERSYETFLANKREDVVSEYADGKFLVVTTVTPGGEVTQVALCREDLGHLPAMLRNEIEKHLNRPAEKGWLMSML